MRVAILVAMLGCGHDMTTPPMPDGPPPNVLDVDPATYVVPIGRSQIFAAAGATGWSVMEGDAGGSVDVNGNYTAPLVAGTYHVVATDGTDQGVATVTVADLQLERVAGQLGGLGYTDDIGTAARMSFPIGVAIDSQGTVYVADGTSTIRKVDRTTYAVSLLAGSPNQSGVVDGVGQAARFSVPYGLALDEAHGMLYVSDFGANVIRKVVIATGEVSTLAGTAGVSGAGDGTGTGATFSNPAGISFDGVDTLWVADSSNCLIRTVAVDTGVVTTIGGLANNCVENDTPARFDMPTGILFSSNVVFVADRFAVRAITAFGVTTIAGSGAPGFVNQPGVAARFDLLEGITSDGTSLYVTDSENHAVRSIGIAAPHTVATVAGGTSGVLDGTGTAAQFASIRGVAYASSRLWVVDGFGLRTIDGGGVVTSVVGEPPHTGYTNGSYDTALLCQPHGIATDGAGTMYVTEQFDVRALSDTVSLVAGSSSGAHDGTGASAEFGEPLGVALDASGTLYVADSENYSVRQVTVPGGVVTTPFDSITFPMPQTLDSTGTASRFVSPTDVVVVGTTLYVADIAGLRIRAVDLSSTMTTTLAGSDTKGHADGIGGTTSFTEPSAIASDGTALYIGDGSTIRKIDLSTSTVTTIAGTFGVVGNADGIGTLATFDSVVAMTYDGHGTLYIVDGGSQLVRRLYLPTGAVSTFAGVPYHDGIRLGSVTSAQLGVPTGIAIQDARTILLTSTNENAIVELVQP